MSSISHFFSLHVARFLSLNIYIIIEKLEKKEQAMDTAAAAGSSSRINRTSSERERRMRLRDLYSHLSSLLPPQPTKVLKLSQIHRLSLLLYLIILALV